MRVFIVGLFSYSILLGAFEQIPHSPGQMGTGYSDFLSINPSTGFLHHPAVLANVKSTILNISYTSHFQLTALNQYQTSFAFPSRLGGIGISLSTFGEAQYKETTLSFGFGKWLKSNFSAGILINFHQLTIRRYGNYHETGIHGSFSFNLSPEIQWSLLYQNLNSPKIGGKEHLPQVIATGITFSSSAFTGVMELEQDLEFPSRLKFGFWWKPIQFMSLTTGYLTNPPQITASAGFHLEHYEFSYAVALHNSLPLTHGFSFQHQLR